MQHFDAHTTRDRLAFPALIDALRNMFVAGCEVPQRHSHRIADAHHPGTIAGTVTSPQLGTLNGVVVTATSGITSLTGTTAGAGADSIGSVPTGPASAITRPRPTFPQMSV